MALPLGASSEADMMEIVLTERMNPEDVRARLAEELPAGMRLTEVEDMPVKYLNGDTWCGSWPLFHHANPFVLFFLDLARGPDISPPLVRRRLITRVGNDWPFGHN